MHHRLIQTLFFSIYHWLTWVWYIYIFQWTCSCMKWLSKCAGMILCNLVMALVCPKMVVVTIPLHRIFSLIETIEPLNVLLLCSLKTPLLSMCLFVADSSGNGSHCRRFHFLRHSIMHKGDSLILTYQLRSETILSSAGGELPTSLAGCIWNSVAMA